MSDVTFKTLLIAHPSADAYGADLQLLESVSAMVDNGWRVVVAVPATGRLVTKLQDRGAEVGFINFPVVRRANTSARGFASMTSQAVRVLPNLVRTIRQFDPAVVYVNTITLPWWLLASRIAGRTTICHVHEAEPGDDSLVLKALLSPLRLADVIIAISRSTFEAMIDVVPSLRGRTHLIYNGVPQPPYEPHEAARMEPIRAVVVGRLSPRKAQHLALDAVGLLRERGYNIELELAGTEFAGYEYYREELEDRASRPDLEGAVLFSGYVSPVWPALIRSDIVIAPALKEPFGNAVVEAQLARRPVVATKALGHTESIVNYKTGILVDPNDPHEMADAIAQLIDDPELARRLADAGRDNATRRFNVQRYRDEIYQLVSAASR